MDISIQNEIKFALLQMAAEAFLLDENEKPVDGKDLIDSLRLGNRHNSKFTEAEATAFALHWRVVDQMANTGTGFSGTLFECILSDPATGALAGEKVMSFRSTEFVDDDVRDSLQTNTYEIKQTGWAWGQLRDMEAWYNRLNAGPDVAGGPGILNGESFAVTGYSLGGHLATAFNLLHLDRAAEVVTFNGAGVGRTDEGRAPFNGLKIFTSMSTDGGHAIATALEEPLASIYRAIRAGLENTDEDKRWTIQKAKDYLLYESKSFNELSSQNPAFEKDLNRLTMALYNIGVLTDEGARIKGLTSGEPGNESAHPLDVNEEKIDALHLDYQLAVAFAAETSGSATLVNGLWQAYTHKAMTDVILSNQIDIVGMTDPSAVSNSQWHAGQDVRVFIEDQPLYRGGVTSEIVKNLLEGFRLLQDHYSVAAFGDTHSLVLLQDALKVENLLANLLAPDQRNSSVTIATLNSIFENISNLRKTNGDLAVGNGQGTSVGDVLENVLNALGDMLGVFTASPSVIRLKGDPHGNTWAGLEDKDGYTGRNSFYKLVDAIMQRGYTALQNQTVLSPPAQQRRGRARFLWRAAQLVVPEPFCIDRQY